MLHSDIIIVGTGHPVRHPISVPWPVLDRHLGQQMSEMVGRDGVTWNVGRQRGGTD